MNRWVVQGADQVLIALVEILGIDAVADVDEALGRELADVAGAHLVDSEAHRAVIGVGSRSDEHDVGKRLDRATDRDVDQRLAPRRRRLLLGDGDRWGDEGDGCHQQRRESPDHGRQRRPGPARGRQAPPGDTGRVGYNPYRRFRARPIDYVLVVVCLLVAIGLIAWAIAG